MSPTTIAPLAATCSSVCHQELEFSVHLKFSSRHILSWWHPSPRARCRSISARFQSAQQCGLATMSQQPLCDDPWLSGFSPFCELGGQFWYVLKIAWTYISWYVYNIYLHYTIYILLYRYIYIYTTDMSDTVSQRGDKLPQTHTVSLEMCMAKIFKRSSQSFSLSDEILSRVMKGLSLASYPLRI